MFFGGLQDISCARDLAALQSTFYAWRSGTSGCLHDTICICRTFFPHVQFTLQNSSSPSTDQTPWKFSAENFDIRRDPLFWDELKAGFVRKITTKVPSFSPRLKSQ
jgi:hypothetical protein